MQPSNHKKPKALTQSDVQLEFYVEHDRWMALLTPTHVNHSSRQIYVDAVPYGFASRQQDGISWYWTNVTGPKSSNHICLPSILVHPAQGFVSGVILGEDANLFLSCWMPLNLLPETVGGPQSKSIQGFKQVNRLWRRGHKLHFLLSTLFSERHWKITPLKGCSYASLRSRQLAWSWKYHFCKEISK